ncbi:MAG: acyl-ACP--UDP-N-acetylglucosamine O-acyltransferase [Psychromonas sp.]|jgi:acyl-ACP--UDP-N-acetylglucosamine O-acyltransferase
MPENNNVMQHSSSETHCLISPNTVIDSQATIGKNVSIGAFTVIEADVVVGEGTQIGTHVTLLNGTRIGSNCQVLAGVVLAGMPQDFKYNGGETLVEIGNNTILREYVTIHRGTQTRGKTSVGSNSLIMANTHVGHDCMLGNNCIVGYSVGIAGETVIEDWANISSLIGIHQCSKIGAYAMVGGLTKVVKDVPPYIKTGRDPLIYAGVNAVLLKRCGFSREKIDEIQDIYRVLFERGKNTAVSLECIESNFNQSLERDSILRFVRNSKRGIVKGILK